MEGYCLNCAAYCPLGCDAMQIDTNVLILQGRKASRALKNGTNTGYARSVFSTKLYVG